MIRDPEHNRIKELLEIILTEMVKNFRKDNTKDNLTFLPLINYLRIYQMREKSEKECKMLQEIINATTSIHTPSTDDSTEEVCQLHSLNKQKEIRCFRMILVSRYTIGGFYSMQADAQNQYDVFTDKNFTPVKLLNGKSYWRVTGKEGSDLSPCLYPFKEMQYVNVLGRYDAMSFTRTRPICRCPLPYFRANETQYPYKFPSLLVRREFGIRVDLNSKKQCTRHINPDLKNGLAMVGSVSVELKRRALRIPFLARLLASVQDENTPRMGLISEKDLIGKYLCSKTDTVLLLDGSVDFFIAVCHKIDANEESKLQRITDTIDLAYQLYQDFMVARTEIILDASSLDNIVKKILEDPEYPYSLECSIRFFEDQFLDFSMKIFQENLFQEIEKFNEKTEEGEQYSLLTVVELTPGKMDLSLKFFNIEMQSIKKIKRATEWKFILGHKRSFRDNLTELLEPNRLPPCIDRVEININRNQYNNYLSAPLYDQANE